MAPKVCFIGGNSIASYMHVNNNSDIVGLPKVLYLPKYNVTLAELIIPVND